MVFCLFGTGNLVGETVSPSHYHVCLSGLISGVDRIPGHPASVDALVAMTDDVIATGSEDGMIRVMQILPNKFRMFGHLLSVDVANNCSGCDCDT